MLEIMSLTLELTPECMLKSGMARMGIQIGKVSEQTGLSIDAIRFYEKQRLLERPPRTGGGFRLFDAQDIERIQFIRRAQQLGFSLPEIRELLVLGRGDGEGCSHVRDLLQAKVATVRRKIAELGVLEEQLTKSLRKCERQLRAARGSHEGCCPVIEGIAHRGPNEN
jgi:MerR family transcriptional regulator, mercuric resistance operon regulatory protein